MLKYIRHMRRSYYFFFNDTATTEIYTLSLHDALPIYDIFVNSIPPGDKRQISTAGGRAPRWRGDGKELRSEEHTSELQSRPHLVCRLLLEKKNILAPKEKYNQRPVRNEAHIWQRLLDK